MTTPNPKPDFTQIPEFDRVMRALVQVPKAEVDKMEAKRQAAKKKSASKPKSK